MIVLRDFASSIQIIIKVIIDLWADKSIYYVDIDGKTKTLQITRIELLKATIGTIVSIFMYIYNIYTLLIIETITNLLVLVNLVAAASNMYKMSKLFRPEITPVKWGLEFVYGFIRAKIITILTTWKVTWEEAHVIH